MVITIYALKEVEQEVLNEFNSTITHIALGDGYTEPTENDLTLENEFFRESLFDNRLDLNTWKGTIFLDTTEANLETIRESGTFTASIGGDMLTRTLTNWIYKTDVLEVFVEENIIINAINL